MTDLARFTPTLPPLTLMVLFGLLGWQSLTIACGTVFFAVVFVVCMDQLRADLRQRH